MPASDERHVGLGLAAEIDRAVIDLLGHRLGEFRSLERSSLAADHVHGEPRYPQLLLAGGIELRQLGDRRHLAQEPQPVEPALVDRARRPWQLRGPADLALDLLDELADLGGGGLGLLALDADQRGLVLLIGEPDLEQAVGEQRDTHDREEQRDIFAEQRLRTFVPDEPAAGAASATGDAVNAGLSDVSGCREMLILLKLARTGGIVSCGSAGGSFDDLVRGREQRRRDLDSNCRRCLLIDDQFELGRLLDG